jgi:hypothetical protein
MPHMTTIQIVLHRRVGSTTPCRRAKGPGKLAGGGHDPWQTTSVPGISRRTYTDLDQCMPWGLYC